MSVDRVSVLLSLQRALWEQVTPNLRGVAVAWRAESDDQCIAARFLYEAAVGDRERECVSSAEAHCIADFVPPVTVEFRAIEHGALLLLPGEEWVHLRWEPAV